MTTTLTATPEPGNDPPRVLLELEWTAATEATVARQDPDGRIRTIRTADPAALSGGLWVGYDYESWFGQSTVYQATVSGTTIESSPVTLTVDRAWLRHPGVPSLSMVADISGDASRVHAANRAVLEPLGRAYPIVVTDGQRKAPVSSLTLETDTLLQRQALLDLVADCAVLLLDVPPAWASGLDHQYVSLGDITEDRVNRRKDVAWRRYTVPYDVVDAPAGGLQAQRTYADLLVYSTYADLDAAYATYTDMLSGAEIGS